MMRSMCKSKIHRATVTESCLDYEGSIEVDQALLEAADIAPYEMVQVLNINNGHRFETYAIPAKRDSGMICLNGAAARLGLKGDKVILLSTCILPDKDVRSFQPKIVFVNEHNRIVRHRSPVYSNSRRSPDDLARRRRANEWTGQHEAVTSSSKKGKNPISK